MPPPLTPGRLRLISQPDPTAGPEHNPHVAFVTRRHSLQQMPQTSANSTHWPGIPITKNSTCVKRHRLHEHNSEPTICRAVRPHRSTFCTNLILGFRKTKQPLTASNPHHNAQKKCENGRKHFTVWKWARLPSRQPRILTPFPLNILQENTDNRSSGGPQTPDLHQNNKQHKNIENRRGARRPLSRKIEKNLRSLSMARLETAVNFCWRLLAGNSALTSKQRLSILCCRKVWRTRLHRPLVIKGACAVSEKIKR